MLADITITGNLAADPELRFTPGGKAVATFTVMTSRSVKNADGTWDNDVDVTGWRCTVWEQVAENVAESLTRGMAVIVIGRAKYRSYETKEGEKRGTTEVDVFHVGPSLARATARVTKVSRNAGTALGAAPKADDPWATSDEPPF